jgi:FkbM family methyltransferase
MHLQRGLRLLHRKRRAKKLGFKFPRADNFSIPPEIRIAGQSVPIDCPRESGVLTSFVEILLDDCYGLETATLAPDGRILDVGANAGFFSLAARNAFPDATIHAYEPNPFVLRFIERHAAAADFAIFAEAVGRHDGMIRLVDHPDSVQVRTHGDPSGHIPQIGFCRAVERVGGRCDLVKLDCEGAEWQILADGGPWRHVDRLVMEYHLWANDQMQHEEICPFLKSIGFRIRRQIACHPAFGVVWATRGDIQF